MAQVHEFRVEMTCEGCAGAVKKVLGKLKDKIEDVDVDVAKKSVKVKTTLPANEILEIIKKTGKPVEHVPTV